MKDLPTVIAAAEALVDIHHFSSSSSNRGKAGDKGKKNEGKDTDSRDNKVPSGGTKEPFSSKKFWTVSYATDHIWQETVIEKRS